MAVDSPVILAEAPPKANYDPAEILARAPSLSAYYRNGGIRAAEYAAQYVLLWQVARHGARAATRRSRFGAKPNPVAWLSELETLASQDRASRLIEIFDNYDLRLVSRRVNLALIGWLRGEWLLELHEKVPSVRDVLRLQARGMRPVTVIADYPRMLEPVLEKPDGFAFICHDLEHAWQFFHDPVSRDAQRRFAQTLDQAWQRGLFSAFIADPIFAQKLDYLAADMNTHVAHSLQYLRAILVEHHLRTEAKGPNEQLSPESRESVERCLAPFDFTQEQLLSPGHPRESGEVNSGDSGIT